MKVPFKRAQGSNQDFSRSAQPGGRPQLMRMKHPVSQQGMGVPAPQSSKKPKGDDTLTNKIIDTIVQASIYLTMFLLPLFFVSSVPSI